MNLDDLLAEWRLLNEAQAAQVAQEVADAFGLMPQAEAHVRARVLAALNLQLDANVQAFIATAKAGLFAGDR